MNENSISNNKGNITIPKITPRKAFIVYCCLS